MNPERRKFLQHLAALCGTGVARSLGVGVGTAAVAATGTAAAASGITVAAAGTYAYGVRQQVFEVIVRQAMAGAPWKQICAGPMQVNGISADEVQSEVNRRKLGFVPKIAHKENQYCGCDPCSTRRRDAYKRLDDRVASIPHSPQSPCACANCRQAVRLLINEIASEEISPPDR